MDDKGLGLIALIVLGLVGVVVLVGAVGGIYYATDGAVDAKITGTRCASGEVDIVTKFPIPGIPYTLTDMNSAVCKLFTQPGNVATYNLQSERVRLYTDDAKDCLKYDSENEKYSLSGCL